jgi:hypothetical protein
MLDKRLHRAASAHVAEGVDATREVHMDYHFAFATLALTTLAVAGCSGDSGGPTSPASSSNRAAGTTNTAAAATPVGTATSGLGGTTSVVGTGLVGNVAVIVPATVNVLSDVTAASGSALGTPLIDGPLLTTDGVGSGTIGILSAGTTNELNVNVPSPILANTAVLPSGLPSTR